MNFKESLQKQLVELQEAICYVRAGETAKAFPLSVFPPAPNQPEPRDGDVWTIEAHDVMPMSVYLHYECGEDMWRVSFVSDYFKVSGSNDPILSGLYAIDGTKFQKPAIEKKYFVNGATAAIHKSFLRGFVGTVLDDTYNFVKLLHFRGEGLKVKLCHIASLKSSCGTPVIRAYAKDLDEDGAKPFIGLTGCAILREDDPRHEMRRIIDGEMFKLASLSLDLAGY